ncbi:hypothetical protein BegalDRAFT_2259 [Beggiatoa alba B18LD]|uniref:Uncharacterized protein n=2 Tax=Beggiatoa alba TaxID=1022 RepID=I3CHM0_9GAMM|nr:hypothetical protein BegalDRAFT_2259 [Beggiatoa alba B18LD]
MLIAGSAWATSPKEEQEIVLAVATVNIASDDGSVPEGEPIYNETDTGYEPETEVPPVSDGEPVIEEPAIEPEPETEVPPVSDGEPVIEEPTTEPEPETEVPPVSIPSDGPKTTITATLHVFMQENTHQLAGFYFDLPALPTTGQLQAATLHFKNAQAGEYITGQFDIYAEMASTPVLFSLKNPLTPRQLSTYASPYVPHSHWQADEAWTLDVTRPVQAVLQADRCNQALALIAKSTDKQGYNFQHYTVNEKTVYLELTFAGQQQVATDASRCIVTQDTLTALNALPSLAGLSVAKTAEGLLYATIDGVKFMLAPLALVEKSFTKQAVEALSAGQFSFVLANGQTLVTTPVVQDLPVFKQAIKTINGLGNATVTTTADGKVIIQQNGVTHYTLIPDISSTPVLSSSSLGLILQTEYMSFVFLDAQGQKREQRLYFVW